MLFQPPRTYWMAWQTLEQTLHMRRLALHALWLLFVLHHSLP